MFVRSILFASALALVLTAISATAQGYNTLVIEVPYEVSLPASVQSGRMFCEVSFGPRGMVLRGERSITLVNGQGSGSMTFGWDLNGSAPDLDIASPDALKSVSQSPDFNANVSCQMDSFRGTAAGLGSGMVRGSNGAYFLGDGDGDRILLDATNDPSVLRATFTHADNKASGRAANATATVPSAQVPVGLQGLQSILEGQ